MRLRTWGAAAGLVVALVALLGGAVAVFGRVEGERRGRAEEASAPAARGRSRGAQAAPAEPAERAAHEVSDPSEGGSRPRARPRPGLPSGTGLRVEPSTDPAAAMPTAATEGEDAAVGADLATTTSTPPSPRRRGAHKGPATVRVRVLAHEDGAPIADARVRFLAGESAVERRTSIDGRATLVVADPVRVEVRADAPGRTRERAATDEALRGRDVDLVLRLRRGIVLQGRAVEAISDTVGLPGVGIAVYRAEEWFDEDPRAPAPRSLAEDETDDDGCFELHALQPFRSYVVAASADGRARVAAVHATGHDALAIERLTLELPFSRSLAGTARDAEGAPVEGTWVFALEMERVPIPEQWFKPPMDEAEWREAAVLAHLVGNSEFLREAVARARRARTDAAGRFRIVDAPAGVDLAVLAIAPWGGRAPLVEAPPDADPPLDLVLRGTTEMRVHVRRGQEGIPGARVTTWPFLGARFRETGAGNYGPARFGAGPLDVRVDTDRETVCFVGSGGEGQAVSTTDLPTGQIKIVGRVSDDRGPVRSARVETGGPRTFTDAEGRFELHAWRDARWGVRVETALHVPAVSAPGSDPAHREIDLRRTGRARGRLLLPPGLEAPQWFVALARPQDVRSEERPDLESAVRREWADGWVAWERLPPGILEVDVEVPGCLAERWIGTVEPGETCDLGELRLRSAAEREVAVVGAAGEPLPGAWIRVLFPAGPRELVADDAGVARFVSPIDSGRLSVWAWAPSHVPVAREEILSDEGRVTVALARGQLVRGRVLDADGRPLEGSRVEVDGPSGQAATRTHPDGRFRVVAPADSRRLVVRTPSPAPDVVLEFAEAPGYELLLRVTPP